MSLKNKIQLKAQQKLSVLDKSHQINVKNVMSAVIAERGKYYRAQGTK